jgi:hypothetical protein
MFTAITASCQDLERMDRSHVNIVASADVILGVALLIIGGMSLHFEFLPLEFQYAFIGAGTAYTLGILAGIGLIVKLVRAPSNFLITMGDC